MDGEGDNATELIEVHQDFFLSVNPSAFSVDSLKAPQSDTAALSTHLVETMYLRLFTIWVTIASTHHRGGKRLWRRLSTNHHLGAKAASTITAATVEQALQATLLGCNWCSYIGCYFGYHTWNLFWSP